MSSPEFPLKILPVSESEFKLPVCACGSPTTLGVSVINYPLGFIRILELCF